MPFDIYLEDRLTQLLEEMSVFYTKKKMFGGLCFMVDDKMCVGIVKDNLMARVGKEFHDEGLTYEGASDMGFSGRPLNGFLFVAPIGIYTDDQLEFWVDKCIAYNPFAKSSKKK